MNRITPMRLRTEGSVAGRFNSYGHRIPKVSRPIEPPIAVENSVAIATFRPHL